MKLRRDRILRSSKIRVGITLGDPSGIGPAITLKALEALKGAADFVVIGDTGVIARSEATKQSRSKGEIASLAFGGLAMTRFIDLKNVLRKDFKFGQVKAEYGRASLEYIDKGLELIKNKEIDCLVTCPVSKEAINLAGKKFSGHTEYLRERTKAKKVLMVLLNDRLKFGLVTRHIRIKDVPFEVNESQVCETVKMFHRALRDLFLIKAPRIIVCGLNPHASDNGLMGDEENKIIKPAVKKINYVNQGTVSQEGNGPYCFGPLPADIAILKAYQGEFDGIVAMYHDQALIPLKLTGAGANLTYGLPFIRTSPLHGTAFDIAAFPEKADPASLISAIGLAVKCASIQKRA